MVESLFTSKTPSVCRVPIPTPAKMALDTQAFTGQAERYDTVRAHRRDISPRYLQFALR